MDQARNQVVWCRGRMGGVDVPHELVKVMSGILTSYPTKTRMSAVGPLNFYFVTSHPIPFHSIHPKEPWNLPPNGHLAETNFICKTNTC